jgi:hypothetical protein
MIIGLALLIVGLILFALGIILLPLAGIIAAIPVISLALFFFRSDKWGIRRQPELRQEIEVLLSPSAAWRESNDSASSAGMRAIS